MPFNLHVNLGNLDPLRERFEAFDARLRVNLIRAIRESALDVEVRAKELVTGPVLRVRSGTLRRSIHSQVEAFDGGVRGIISTNVPYARIHELGGIFHVPEHIRRVTEAFGRRLRTPTYATVRAHEVRFPERPFMRRALSEMTIQIRARIRQAVREAVGIQP